MQVVAKSAQEQLSGRFSRTVESGRVSSRGSPEVLEGRSRGISAHYNHSHRRGPNCAPAPPSSFWRRPESSPRGRIDERTAPTLANVNVIIGRPDPRSRTLDEIGVLSHCAIVSREYRIPCVVGTIVGTAVIQDGMQLTVDSSRGIVRIDSRQADSLHCLGIQALIGLT
ncbi:MAG: hypothetical protein IH961_10480 [Chloroflexi bacterium]|nr:hypothetical protein [Chloroflexota bacterium]